MGLLTALRKKVERAEPDAVVVEEAPSVELGPEGPQLAVLVPDTAGISSFRLQLLPTAAAAEERVASLRTDVRQSTHAFWALHDKPIVDESMHVESLVLIRADTGSDLVYVVSFLDIESALSFTRFEVRRGLHIGNVMIYWAAFVNIREELSGVSIRPAAPPATGATTVQIAPRPRTSTTDGGPREPEVAITPEPQPEAISPVETEAREAVQRYLREADRTPPAPMPVIEDRTAVIEPPVVEPRIVDEPEAEPEELLSPPEAETPAVHEKPEEFDEPLWPTTIAEPVAFDAPAPIAGERAVEAPVAYNEPITYDATAEYVEPEVVAEPTVFQHKVTVSALEAAGLADGMLVESEAEAADERSISELRAYAGEEEVLDTRAAAAADERLELTAIAERLLAAEPETVESIPGDEERDIDPRITARFDPTTELIQTPVLDDFDIAYEVQRFLENRKGIGDHRDGPFNGFSSPPGRF